MKRLFAILSALTCFLTALPSCEEGLFAPKEASDCTVQASAVQECLITRVGVNPVNGKFEWKTDDTIAVNPSATGKFKPFALTAGAGDSFGEFHGKLAASAVNGAAVYPWSAKPEYTGGRLRISIPRVRVWQKDTLALPMYAPAEDFAQWNIFYFKPVAGIVRVTLPSVNPQTSALVLSAGHCAVSGYFTVDEDQQPASISPRILNDGVTEGSDTTAVILFPKGNAASDTAFNFVVPPGEYPELKLYALSFEGDTLQAYKTQSVTVQRGGISWVNAKNAGGGPLWKKVSSAKDSWTGEYLLVCEQGDAAYVMCTDSRFVDADTPSFQVELTPDGIPVTESLNAGLLTVRAHKADNSGTGPATDQAGKYTMFIQDGRGIGRFARGSFGFNNNASAGRFVETFTYDASSGCIRISCATKNQGAYLKFNTSSHVFGMGLSSEITGSEFVDVQLYELAK